MQLPVLNVTSSTLPCVVYINGAVVGDTAQPPVVPIVPNGKVYVTCFPLGANALPVTICLALENGTLTAPIENGTLYLHPDGLMELNVQPMVFPTRKLTEPPHAISRARFTWDNAPHAATLYQDNGLKLAIENLATDALVFLCAADAPGKVRIVNAFTRADVVLESENRFLMVSPLAGGFRAVIDERARAEITPGRVVCVRRLQDARGHEARLVYTPSGQGVKCTPPQYGFFTVTPRENCDVRRALVEAVSLGLEEECMLLMTPALKDGLSFEDMQDFLGRFTAIHTADDQGLTLAYPLFENCYSLKRFGFSVQNNLVANIMEE